MLSSICARIPIPEGRWKANPRRYGEFSDMTAVESGHQAQLYLSIKHCGVGAYSGPMCIFMKLRKSFQPPLPATKIDYECDIFRKNCIFYNDGSFIHKAFVYQVNKLGTNLSLGSCLPQMVILELMNDKGTA